MTPIISAPTYYEEKMYYINSILIFLHNHCFFDSNIENTMHLDKTETRRSVCSHYQELLFPNDASFIRRSLHSFTLFPKTEHSWSLRTFYQQLRFKSLLHKRQPPNNKPLICYGMQTCKLILACFKNSSKAISP